MSSHGSSTQEQKYLPEPLDQPEVVQAALIHGRPLRHFVRVLVSGKDRNYCLEHALQIASGKRKWSSRNDSTLYNVGILNSSEFPAKTEYVGFLGEVAFAKLLSQPVDHSFKKGGDSFDFKINGRTIDVKCTQSRHPGLFIRGRTPRELHIPADMDYYVGAWLAVDLPHSPEYSEGCAAVYFYGYTTGSEVSKRRLVPSRVSGIGHLNYDVPVTMLRPMSEFLDLFGVRYRRVPA